MFLLLTHQATSAINGHKFDHFHYVSVRASVHAPLKTNEPLCCGPVGSIH